MLNYESRELVIQSLHADGFRYRPGMMPVWRKVTPSGTVGSTEADVIAVAGVALDHASIDYTQADLEAAMPAFRRGLACVQTEARLLVQS